MVMENSLKSELLHALFMLKNLNYQRFRRWRFDMNLPAFALLKQLQAREAKGETGGAWISEMKEYLCVSKAAVSQMLGSLEKRGLITREPDPENRRTIIVKMTDAGRETIEQYERSFDNFIGMLVERFGEKDTREIIRLICKFAEISEELD
jgi:DNA-binding MarR family transcriptional regulator